MASLWHGFEEPGDVQDIRLVVDTIPTLAWSVVQTARQSFSIGAGWTIRVYLQSKLWTRDGRLRFIQTTCQRFGPGGRRGNLRLCGL
jgi:uncharacterized protein (DUF849 family)